jgi:hypothetical protein
MLVIKKINVIMMILTFMVKKQIKSVSV